MFYGITWFLTLALLGAWSLFMWVLHGLAAWSMAGAGTLLAQSQKIDPALLPAWITVWLPPDWMSAAKAAAADVLPWLESALSALPSPQVWLGPLAWTVWGVGSLILLLAAVLIHTLIAVTRKAARQ